MQSQKLSGFLDFKIIRYQNFMNSSSFWLSFFYFEWQCFLFVFVECFLLCFGFFCVGFYFVSVLFYWFKFYVSFGQLLQFFVFVSNPLFMMIAVNNIHRQMFLDIDFSVIFGGILLIQMLIFDTLKKSLIISSYLVLILFQFFQFFK